MGTKRHLVCLKKPITGTEPAGLFTNRRYKFFSFTQCKLVDTNLLVMFNELLKTSVLFNQWRVCLMQNTAWLFGKLPSPRIPKIFKFSLPKTRPANCAHDSKWTFVICWLNAGGSRKEDLKFQTLLKLGCIERGAISG